MEFRYGKKALSFIDMFSEVPYYINKFYLSLKYKKKKQINKMALNMLSENQQFAKRAFTAYESDICIEFIIRSIKKLEAGLAAVIGDDPRLIKDSKLLYYSNIINFKDRVL